MFLTKHLCGTVSKCMQLLTDRLVDSVPPAMLILFLYLDSKPLVFVQCPDPNSALEALLKYTYLMAMPLLDPGFSGCLRAQCDYIWDLAHLLVAWSFLFQHMVLQSHPQREPDSVTGS